MTSRQPAFAAAPKASASESQRQPFGASRGWDVGALDRPGDRHERQAERAADAVESPEPAAVGPRAFAPNPPPPPAALAPHLRAARAEARPLAPDRRAFYESRLGGDFRAVRVHAGPAADAAAGALRAQAFTRGQDIYFAQNYYRPDSPAGRRLMAHEIAHTAQERPNALARRALDPSTSELPALPQPQSDEAEPPAGVAEELDAGLENDPADRSGAANDRLARMPPAPRRAAAAALQARAAEDPSKAAPPLAVSTPPADAPTTADPARAKGPERPGGAQDSARRAALAQTRPPPAAVAPVKPSGTPPAPTLPPNPATQRAAPTRGVASQEPAPAREPAALAQEPAAPRGAGPAPDDGRPLRLADLLQVSAAATPAAGEASANESDTAPKASPEAATAEMEALAGDLQAALADARGGLAARSTAAAASIRQSAGTARGEIRARVGAAVKKIAAARSSGVKALSDKATDAHALVDMDLATRREQATKAGDDGKKSINAKFGDHRKNVDDVIAAKTLAAQTLRDNKAKEVQRLNEADIETVYKLAGDAMRRYGGTMRGAAMGSAAFDVAEGVATKMREQQPDLISAIEDSTAPLVDYFQAQGPKALENFDVNLPKILADVDGSVAKTDADLIQRARASHTQLDALADKARADIEQAAAEATAEAQAFGPKIEAQLDGELWRALKAVREAPEDIMRRLSPPIEEAIALYGSEGEPDLDAARALNEGLKGFVGGSVASVGETMAHAAAVGAERFGALSAGVRQGMETQTARVETFVKGARAGVERTMDAQTKSFDGAAADVVGMLDLALTHVGDDIQAQLSPIVAELTGNFDETLHDAEGKIDSRVQEGFVKNNEALMDLRGDMADAAEQAAYEYDHPVLSSIEYGLEFALGVIAALLLAAVIIFGAPELFALLGLSVLEGGLLVLAATIGFALGEAFAARLDAGQGVGDAFVGAFVDFGHAVPTMLYDMTGIPELKKAFSDERMSGLERGWHLGKGFTDLIMAVLMVRGAAEGVVSGFKSLPPFRPPVATPELPLSEIVAPRGLGAGEGPLDLPAKTAAATPSPPVDLPAPAAVDAVPRASAPAPQLPAEAPAPKLTQPEPRLPARGAADLAPPDNVRPISSAKPGYAGEQPQLKAPKPLTPADEFAARRAGGKPAAMQPEPQLKPGANAGDAPKLESQPEPKAPTPAPSEPVDELAIRRAQKAVKAEPAAPKSEDMAQPPSEASQPTDELAARRAQKAAKAQQKKVRVVSRAANGEEFAVDETVDAPPESATTVKDEAPPDVRASAEPPGGEGPTFRQPSQGGGGDVPEVVPRDPTPRAAQASEKPALLEKPAAKTREANTPRDKKTPSRAKRGGKRGASEKGEPKTTRAQKRGEARRDADSFQIQREIDGEAPGSRQNARSIDELFDNQEGFGRGTTEPGDYGGVEVRRGPGGRQVVQEDRVVSEAAGSAFERPMVRDYRASLPRSARTFASGNGTWTRLKAEFPRLAQLYSGGERPDALSIDVPNRRITLFDATSKFNPEHWEKTLGYMERLVSDPLAQKQFAGFEVVGVEQYWQSGYSKFSPKTTMTIGGSAPKP